MAEAEELLQKLQGLLPHLQDMMELQGQSCREGAGLFHAHVALLWAMTCMERCSRRDPSGQGSCLLAPGISALPQVHFRCCFLCGTDCCTSHGVHFLLMHGRVEAERMYATTWHAALIHAQHDRMSVWPSNLIPPSHAMRNNPIGPLTTNSLLLLRIWVCCIPYQP